MHFFPIAAILAILFTTTTASTNVRGSSNERQLTDDAELEHDQSIYFDPIRLSAPNAVAPFVAAPNAAGIVELALQGYSNSYEICIYNLVITGFRPGQFHLHKSDVAHYADSIAVDFSKDIKESETSFCRTITKTLLDDIAKNPDGYYLDAHVGTNANVKGSYNLSIRGQLMQGVSTQLLPKNVVTPNLGKANANGNATVSADVHGELLCLDATIAGFDPLTARLVKGPAGRTGSTVASFTSTRKAKGRFYGCITPSDGDLTKEVIHSPNDYFLMFHQAKTSTDPNYKYAIRGQLDW